MPRTHVTPADYDPAENEFTIATVDGNPYLQLGGLATDDDARNLFESIFDGHVGFFQNDRRVAAIKVAAPFDATNGIRLASVPVLTEGESYYVEFTQARPGRDGRDATGGSNRRTGGMQPFKLDGMQGRRYGPMIPFNVNGLGGMHPYTGDGMSGKPSGTPMRGRFPKKRESAADILEMFDGVPELIRDYMWDLIATQIPEGADKSRIQGFIEGYTEAFTSQLKSKLETTEIFNTDEKSKLGLIEPLATQDQTAAEIIALLQALPVGSRLNINWFDGELNIPTNTASWHGAFQLRTAYTSGSIVTDNNNVFIYTENIPASNTTRPGVDARAEHLDVGSPNDLSDLSKSGLTFTVTRRSGASFNLTISSTDIYNAINGMTTAQKNGLRGIIGAAAASHNHDSRYYTEAQSDARFAPVSHNHDSRYYTETESDGRFAAAAHNHDSRYYTETESDSRFAPRSTISATAANVLAALVAMSTTQEGQARGAIKALGNVTIRYRDEQVPARTSRTFTADLIYLYSSERVSQPTRNGFFANSLTVTALPSFNGRVYFTEINFS